MGFSLNLAAHPGIGIVGDSRGNVFFTDLEHVWKIDTQGLVSIAVRDVHTHKLYIDEYDNLYGAHVWYEGEVIDEWGFYVWKLTADGKKQYHIPKTKGFPSNDYLTGDPDGTTYWPEGEKGSQYLKKQFRQGQPSLVCKEPFHNIRWLHYKPGNNAIYLIDHLSVKKVSNEGNVEVLASNLSDSTLPFSFVNDQHKLMGLWFGNDGTLYLAGFAAQKIYQIVAPGKVSVFRRSEGAWGPTGGFFAEDGTLWLLEYSARNRVRVLRIAENGVVSTFRPQ